jgi:RHS repeat-associated protein
VNNQTQALATLTKHLCPKKRTSAGVRSACRHGRFHHLGRVRTFNVAYDLSAARLKNATLKTPGTALRLQEDYLYDGLANVTQRTQAWDTGSFTETFAYDVLNRLSTSTVSGQAAQSFIFDDTGNITTKTGVGSYAYPAQGASAVRPHAIQSIPGVGTGNFGYDTNGNLTSIPGVMTGTWTSYDMPQSITKNGTGGTNASTFTYGPEHQRTKQVRSDGLTVVYAGAQEVETKGSAVTVKTYWPYGVGVEIDRPNTVTELNWMHVDRLGSPIAISDNIGSLRERLAYDAWGKRRTLNGAPLNGTATPNSIDGITDNRGFTGHEMLDLLDLVHMNGRIYDPLFGKFLSADPLIQDPMNGQSYNRYSYVLNNPTNLTDPTGFACAPTTGSNLPDCSGTGGSASVQIEGNNQRSVNDSKSVPAPAKTDGKGNPSVNVKQPGATTPVVLTKGDIYQSLLSGAGNAIANMAVGVANLMIATGDPLGNANLIEPVQPFTPESKYFGNQASETVGGLAAVSGARAFGAGVASKVEGATATAAANLSREAGALETPQLFRGGNSLEARLGVDVKVAKDGLIHPLGTNGKPQGLSLNIDPKDPNIQKYGGAFPVNSLPKGLQAIQSGGKSGHFVVAPATPMTIEKFQQLLNKVQLGNFNAPR